MAEAAELIGHFYEGLRPEQRLMVSEWADRYRWLPPRASSEHGQWRTSRIPYAREILNALSSDDPTREIVWMKGSQIGATEAANCWIGYVIDHAPGPMMLVMPTEAMAKRNSRTRIDPMVQETPRLSERIAPARSRDSGNTVLSKEFDGGILLMTGANSATSLRSTPVRYLYLDEEDGYPADADGEGSPVALAYARTRTFNRKKIFRTSTPTVTGRSSIEKAFQRGTQERYYLPCPHCGHKDYIRWANIHWPEGEPQKAALVCEGCGAEIPEHHKTWMLEHGEWIARFPDRKMRSFHLSALYSPLGWYSWAEAATDFLDAKDNTEALRTFINTVLGESFFERGDAPDWEELYRRREPYPVGTVPEGGAVLTMAVDVQKDRLECEVMAWGRGFEHWSVEVIVIQGDPSTEAPWRELDEVRARQYPTEAGGELPIRAVGVDSGYLTQEVYEYARRNKDADVYALRGVERQQVLVAQPRSADINRSGRRIARGARVWPVGSSMAKREIYGWLRQKPPRDDDQPIPRGWCHFPEYDDEYFRQLCAEQLVATEDRRGFTKLEWQKIRPRNEILDLHVYNRAMAYIIGIDRWQEAQWEAAEADAASKREETGKDGKSRVREKYFTAANIASMKDVD